MSHVCVVTCWFHGAVQHPFSAASWLLAHDYLDCLELPTALVQCCCTKLPTTSMPVVSTRKLQSRLHAALITSPHPLTNTVMSLYLVPVCCRPSCIALPLLPMTCGQQLAASMRRPLAGPCFLWRRLLLPGWWAWWVVCTPMCGFLMGAGQRKNPQDHWDGRLYWSKVVDLVK